MGHEGLRVTLPNDWPCYETISADAPSELEIVTIKPVALTGFLDVAGEISGECRFWVDDNWLGDVSYPGHRTPEIILDAGRHRLDVTAADGACRHSAWGLRPASITCSDSDEATPDNAAVVVILGYERHQGREVCRLLLASARRQGIYLHVRRIGEE
jgi:hypothetical protein